MLSCPVTSDFDQHRFIFVGGLPRSGTTFLAQAIARFPGVSDLTGTGVKADEGQYLQSVYPQQRDAGGSGRFAYSAKMHITEASPLVSEASRVALWDAWSPYWDTTQPMLLEKTPANLLKMRFLQALYPTSSFVLAIRHPIAQAMALRARGWTRRPVPVLIHHWLTAHDVMTGDLAHLDRVTVVRYEDLVAEPDRNLEALQSYLGLDPEPTGEEFQPGLNEAYFRDWNEGDRLKTLARRTSVAWFESKLRRYGYSVRSPTPIGPMASDLPALLPPDDGGR